MRSGSGCKLRLWWSKFTSLAGRRKTIAPVRSVAKRLVLGQTAAAQRDNASSAQSVAVSFGIGNDEVPFNTNRTIVDDCHFRWHSAAMVPDTQVPATTAGSHALARRDENGRRQSRHFHCASVIVQGGLFRHLILALYLHGMQLKTVAL